MKQPVWHVIVLSVFTFKLYFIYWCYKNWRDLSKVVGESAPESTAVEKASHWRTKVLPGHLSSFGDASPQMRALFTLIPYVNNYMFFTLALGICKIYPEKNSFVFAHPVVVSLTLVALSFTLSYLSLLPSGYHLLFLFSVIPLAIAQHLLNKFWDAKEDAGLIVRHGFSLKELVLIILGALALGYVFVSPFLLPASKLN